MVTRSAAAAAAAPPPARGCPDGMPAWLQEQQGLLLQQQVHKQQVQWQQAGIKQQGQHQEEPAVFSGSDAMMWSPVKGCGSQSM